MKTREEIYDIIYNQLGLKDLKAYKEYADSWFKQPYRIPTLEEIELLNPDNIDNNAFWKIAEELFKTDPVSNCQYTKEFSIQEGNRNNLNIYLLDGVLPLLQYFQKYNAKKNVFEIGPGYGALKNWIEANTNFGYDGVDCYPKVGGIHETEKNGLMKRETVELFKERIDICVASNVFQHLSRNQRKQYYKDVSDILAPGCLFFVSQFYAADSYPYCRSADGKQWLRHYGQLTEVQKSEEILSDVLEYFDIDTTTYKRGWVVLILTKKNKKVEEAPIIPIEVEKAA